MDGAGTGTATFPVDFANQMARLESFNKHLYRPNSYLHKWWARRCGTTFRLILKHLVQDPARRDFYEPGGLEGQVILDPMMGGGTTLHEAIRLGANVIGADIDPVPVLQARATLSKLPLARLEAAFETFFQELHGRLGSWFQTTCPHCQQPTPLMYTLYSQRQACDCGTALLVDSTILRYESDGSMIMLCDRCGEVYQTTDAESPHQCTGELLPFPVREKGASACPQCGAPFRELVELPFFARFTPIAVVGHCPEHNLFFKSPNRSDLAKIGEANQVREEIPLGPPRDFVVDSGPKSVDLVNHGVQSYLDLFSTRQLIYLASAIEALGRFDDLVRLNLGLLLSTSTEFNSMLCGYKGGNKRRPGAIRHTFSLHAYSFPYTALENNPLYPEKTSGSLQALFHSRIRRARQWAQHPKERVLRDDRVHEQVHIPGEIDGGQEVSDPAELQTGTHKFYLIQGSSIHLGLDSDSVDHVVTDPPYFDNVQYSDLSAFFRVWLQKLFPNQATWMVDLDGSAVDPQANGNGQYQEILTGIYRECNRVLRPGGRLIFTFHHWNPKGWSALTSALKDAGFALHERYVIHAENPASVHINNLRALKHDAVLVLAAAAQEATDWPLPNRIHSETSESFIRDCADALGWMLSADIDSGRIARLWQDLLAPNGSNGTQGELWP